MRVPRIEGPSASRTPQDRTPCGQPHCILLCLLWPRQAWRGVVGGGGPISWCSSQKTTRQDPTHEPQEDHETGPQFSRDLSLLLIFFAFPRRKARCPHLPTCHPCEHAAARTHSAPALFDSEHTNNKEKHMHGDKPEGPARHLDA